MEIKENATKHSRECLVEASGLQSFNDLNSKPPSCCTDCCSLTCIVCALFCCGPCFKSAPWTLRWIPLCVTVVLIMSAIVIGIQFGYYQKQDFRLSPTDEVPIISQLSLAFCGELTVDSDSRFSAYKFSKKPRISGNQTVRRSWKDTAIAEVNEPILKTLYLLEGSVAKVKFCPDRSAIACGIKGEANIRRWMKQKTCSKFSFEQHPIPGGECKSIEIHAQLSEKIYFVLEVTSAPTWADIKFEVDRKKFDVRAATNECIDTQHCQFLMSLHSYATVVVESGVNGGHDTPIVTRCTPGLLLPICLVVIPAIACVVLLLIYLGMKRHEDKKKQQFVSNYRSLSCRSNIDHSAVVSRTFQSNLLHYNTFENQENKGKC